MVKLTDDILMAYVDGELDDNKAEAVRKAAETDEDARRRIEVFKESASMLQGVFDAPLQEPVPDRLMKTVMEFDKSDPSPGLIERLSTFFSIPWDWKPAYVLVASLALLIGAGSTHLLHTLNESPGKQTAMLLDGEDFTRGMETTTSGRHFTVARGVQITPVATFLDNSNRYCRQYEVVMGQDVKVIISQGVARRNRIGVWSTLLTIYPQTDAITTDSGSGYIPAGEEDITDMVFSGIMSSPPISLQREAALIENSWSSPSTQE